jgi:6,7-dimethyl-8-ribityllumazine synthase
MVNGSGVMGSAVHHLPFTIHGPEMARYDDIEELEPGLNGTGLRVGIVMSRFNIETGEGLLASCTAALAGRGVLKADIRIVTVPGALEIPLALQKLAQTGRFDALIALGAVIRGETYHFEVVANESASGITMVALDTGVPIANGILTTNDDEEAHARMAEKGAECALAAIEMANLLKRIE